MNNQNDWEKHPPYLAHVGSLFGAPPNLKCVDCKDTVHELFYGHCRECCREKGISMKMPQIKAFHETKTGVVTTSRKSIREKLADLVTDENIAWVIVLSIVLSLFSSLLYYTYWIIQHYPPVL